MNDKYVTFKREEFEEAKRAGGGRMYNIPNEVEDAVVIRRQDIYAAPAFRAYSATIASSLVVAAKIVAPGMVIHNTGLESIARYFERQAELSEQEERKVPD